jgi:1,4-alpha-glucan branching enzyme
MIEKQPSVNPGKVLVTFRISQETWADHITLVGDFNDWNETSHPLIRTRSDPDWHITIELDAGRRYQFRYLRDGREWNCDDHADDYVLNPYGDVNCVVDTGE